MSRLSLSARVKSGAFAPTDDMRMKLSILNTSCPYGLSFMRESRFSYAVRSFPDVHLTVLYHVFEYIG